MLKVPSYQRLNDRRHGGIFVYTEKLFQIISPIPGAVVYLKAFLYVRPAGGIPAGRF